MRQITQIRGVRVTNPDRVLYSSMGLTKQDLAEYYLRAERFMLPHLRNRLVSLVRCPQGRERKCFFQRHASDGFPDQIMRVSVPGNDGAVEEYLYLRNIEGVIASVQMGVLEFHIWGSRIDSINKPDRMVLDLDPDEGLDFGAVKAAAVEIRNLLAGLGIETFPMLTGGKGIHLVAPLVRRAEWSQVKAFAGAVSRAVEKSDPDRFVATMSKARRKGRVFVDYFRNDRTATAIAPYSTRSRQGAPVATPITWDEMEQATSGAAFNVVTMAERLKKLRRDPWEGYPSVRQHVSDGLIRTAEAL